MMKQLKGREWEYDYSATHNSISLLMPSPEIVNFGGLRWDGDRGWHDPIGMRQAVAFTSDSEGEALIVNRKYVEEFLSRNKLALVWFAFEQKQVIKGFVGEFVGSLERWSAHTLSGGKIRFLGEEIEVRKPKGNSHESSDSEPRRTTKTKTITRSTRRRKSRG
jgi:hypothetical protein